MANITFPELKETQALPLASGDSLRQLREEMCSKSSSRDFKLQNYQRFLRRVLSPDSPTRSLLMVHGTGTGKTCTAIQIAEEYIIRPEFQDKRVLILANPPVQENFKNQIFNMSNVSIDTDGILLSKQCTGRRYLDMLLRIQSEPLKWTDKATKERMDTVAQNIIKEFYEFQGYLVLANAVKAQEEQGTFESWAHKNFDNRLVIIDEAHNTKVSEDGSPQKLISDALEKLVRTATNMTLILLTATPMYHDYNEIIFYFNLFLWNERKQVERIQPSKIFTKTGEFQPGKEELFRGWCQSYISYIKGDNPLTFPFRLPPPLELLAEPAARDMKNQLIPVEERRNILDLTASYVQGIQEEALKDTKNLKLGFAGAEPILCVFPGNMTFRKTFVIPPDEESQYQYAKDVPKFLAPSTIKNHSSKFALIMKIINESEGLIFVYSNRVDFGAQLFSMCLEEHGYESATGSTLLGNTSGEVEKGSKGKYALFTSKTESDRKRLLTRIKSIENKDGKDIKVIVASPSISEGIDFQYIRQVHILEWWWNMSRIEQAVGRGIRTCSHQTLDFEKQNCTVYLHVCKFADSNRETIDEFYYRTAVELRAKSIAKVKQVIMESAMDCPLQENINSLPEKWRKLEVTQRRSQRNEEVTLTLEDMSSPIFGESSVTCKIKQPKEDPDHERPLSSYLDVRDELLDIFMKLFLKKPIWKKSDLLESPKLRTYNQDVVIYILQNAIETGFQIKDVNGRIGYIESKEDMYAFTLGKFTSLQDRYIKQDTGKKIGLKVQENEVRIGSLQDRQKAMKWSSFIKNKFSQEVLDWYVIDHVMTSEERIEHMLSIDWDNPPIFAVHTKGLKILGSKQIYNLSNEKIVPIGEQADEYNEWLKDRMTNFVESKNDYFASMNKNRDIIFNIDNTSSVLQRAERTKNLSGRACTSYDLNLLSLLAEWLGTPFPNEIRVKTDRCQFISLLIRQAILKGKKGLVWIPPEEWSIFNEPENNKELRTKINV
jgi:superfamily II DNA or RNA helicase